MIGKYKSDWIGVGLLVSALLVLVNPGLVFAAPVTITSASFSEGSGGTFTITVYYSDSSYEIWNYNQYGQGSGSGGAYWAWYTSAGGSGYGAPDASIVCSVDQQTSDYYYAQRAAWIIAHPGQTPPGSVGTGAFNTACSGGEALPFVPPDGVTGCRVEYGAIVPVGDWTDQSINIYGCVSGSESLVASKTCWVGPGGALGCTDNHGNSVGLGDWTGLHTAGTFGTCSCGSGGSCTGEAHWIGSAQVDGSVEWQQTSNTCSGGCQAICPGSAPAADGATATTSCSFTSTGTCPVKQPTCSGTCNYTSIGNAEDGYTWAYSDDTCSTAPNCNCPAQPGGACPTGTGQTKSVSCGADGLGPCTGGGGSGGGGSGSCSSSCVYKWIASSSNPCPNSGCGWAVSVQRNNGVNAPTYAWVQYGNTGTACEECECSQQPETPAQEAYETGNQYISVACDSSAANDGTGRWLKLSGDCGATCECNPPAEPGTTDGQTQTVQCAAKSQTCQCVFNWDSTRSEFLTLLASKFAVAWPTWNGGENCYGLEMNIFGRSLSFSLCASYPNAANAFQATFEIARITFRNFLKFVMWYWFITWWLGAMFQGLK